MGRTSAQTTFFFSDDAGAIILLLSHTLSCSRPTLVHQIMWAAPGSIRVLAVGGKVQCSQATVEQIRCRSWSTLGRNFGIELEYFLYFEIVSIVIQIKGFGLSVVGDLYICSRELNNACPGDLFTFPTHSIGGIRGEV